MSGLRRIEDWLEKSGWRSRRPKKITAPRGTEQRKSALAREFVSHSINRLINIAAPLCDWSARLELRAAGDPIEAPSPNHNAATP
jgi:hypothetical protein